MSFIKSSVDQYKDRDYKENFVSPFALSAISSKKELVPQNALFSFNQGQTKETPTKRMIFILLFMFVTASIFQTLAWYYNVEGNLPFWFGIGITILFISMEYLFLIPANQISYRFFNLIQIGIMIEIIGWVVFTIYVKFIRKEEINNNTWIGLGVMALGVFIAYS